MDDKMLVPSDYSLLLESLKERIRNARVKAALAVNSELVLLYWQIGREILQRREQEGWGAKVIERLGHDLKSAFPEMKGFSPRNLVYMQTLARTYPDEAFTQQVVAQIPWGHNVLILDKIQEPAQREWYMRATIEHGWSRAVLEHQIDSRLYERQGKAVTNFSRTLAPPQSDLAREILKDPYNFDFLTLGDDALERDLERGLVDHIRKFLLELGVGFSFLGSQYHLEVGGEDFYLDLLFYHIKLRCFVVIDLKIGKFTPEDAGKMNFYLSAVDDLLRHETDAPSIGIVLCRTKNAVVAEYALRDMNKPIGVATHQTAAQITASLPETLKGSLPTIEEIEAELGGTVESP